MLSSLFWLHGDSGSTKTSVPLSCRKRRGSLKETAKNDTKRHSMCDTIKIPPCSQAMSAAHVRKIPTYCSPSRTLVFYVKKIYIVRHGRKQSREMTKNLELTVHLRNNLLKTAFEITELRILHKTRTWTYTL